MIMYSSARRGFTLIELLVVISIIALLSSIVMATINTARVRARDAKRQRDMHEIFTALQFYYDRYGCLPTPGSSACNGTTAASEAGGWDYSSQGGGFLPWLETAGLMSKVSVDPTNNMTGDATPSGTFAYRYYCYPSGGSYSGLHLGYWSERTGSYVMKSIPNSGNWADSSFTCK
ncbi:MAG TPA: type II secretion system protein [Candidatus Paceibacterota bacterium]|jgi:prepilin-type N-terminal cleavage/methylation domain